MTAASSHATLVIMTLVSSGRHQSHDHEAGDSVGGAEDADVTEGKGVTAT
jgi:hypothetical protein